MRFANRRIAGHCRPFDNRAPDRSEAAVDGILFDGLDVLRCSRGRFQFLFNDRPSVVIGEVEIVVVYPLHVVTIDALDSDNRLLYGIFGGRDIVAYFDSLGFYDCVKGVVESHGESIMELRRQLEAQKFRSECGDHCLAFLTDILASQAAELRRQGNAIVFDAIRFIGCNIRSGVVRLKTLCERLKVSRVHLHRLFVRAGMGSPSDFIRARQLYHIRELMADGRLTLSEIAVRSGFLTSAHFTTFVKRMTGKTPTQLRTCVLNGDSCDRSGKGGGADVRKRD